MNEQYNYEPEMIEELLKCKNDICYFAKKYFKEFNEDEENILRNFVSEKRICLLNSRGGSNFIFTMVFSLWYSIFNENKSIGFFSHLKGISGMQKEEFLKFYEKIPTWMKPKIEKNDEYKIKLTNGNNLFFDKIEMCSFLGHSLDIVIILNISSLDDIVASIFLDFLSRDDVKIEKSKIIMLSEPNIFHDIHNKGIDRYNNIWKSLTI